MKVNKTWLVSYPRSGNTWMRFLLSNLLHPAEDVNYNTLHNFIPDMHQLQLYKGEWKKAEILKSHFAVFPAYFEPYTKIIYMYRDPRDAALSDWYYQQGEWATHQFHGTLSEWIDKFIEGPGAWGTWREHIWTWCSLPMPSPTLHVCYENLIDNPLKEMRKITEFMGWNFDDEALRRTIQKSCYKNLLNIRARNGQHQKLQGLRGTYGGWKEEFSKEDAEKIWNWAKDLMLKLGYKKCGF